MANVAIVYTGNVCSTPMIEYARLCEDIYVPGREIFDFYQFSQFSTDKDRISEHLSGIFSSLFCRNACGYLEADGLAGYRGGDKIPTMDEKPHVLFKWRCFDLRLPGSHKIADVLKANNVIPVVMLRTSLSTQALKMFLTENVYGRRHQQFMVSKMSKEDYTSYMNEQKDIAVTISDEDVEKIKAIAKNILNGTILQINRAKFYFTHIKKPYLIYTEEIFKPLIDFEQYEFCLRSLFGPIPALDRQREPTIRKGGLELSNCTNVDDVFQNSELRTMELKYIKATQTLEKFFNESALDGVGPQYYARTEQSPTGLGK